MGVGLDLAKKYYEEYSGKLKEGEFEAIAGEMAFGLSGDGSECFGFDDEISQDHDFGPSFCLWIPMGAYQQYGAKLQKVYDELPREMDGFKREETPEARGRRGVIPIEAYFQKYTGKEYGPDTLIDWFKLPEHFLASATNGELFEDNKGQMTEIRERLLAFYPDDVRRKKLAARIFKMAQSGQYNYPRMMKRGDKGAAFLALSEFIKNALSAVFMIEKVYMPFYKWSFKRAEQLPESRSVVEDIKSLVDVPREETIENICMDIKKTIQEEGLSFTKSTFLIDDAMDIMRGIEDDSLRNLPPDYDMGA